MGDTYSRGKQPSDMGNALPTVGRSVLRHPFAILLAMKRLTSCQEMHSDGATSYVNGMDAISCNAAGFTVKFEAPFVEHALILGAPLPKSEYGSTNKCIPRMTTWLGLRFETV